MKGEPKALADKKNMYFQSFSLGIEQLHIHWFNSGNAEVDY